MYFSATDQLMIAKPIPVVCDRCKWSGDIRECPEQPVSYIDFGGELDYEKEPVCPQCGSPTLEG